MPGKPIKKPLSREEKLLQRLLDILNNPAKKQQLPSLPCHDGKDNLPSESVTSSAGANVHPCAEAVVLEQFSSFFQNVRIFSSHQFGNYFTQILEALVKQRLSCTEWITRAPRESVFRVFTCLRMLMRDQSYQQLFFQLGGVKILAERLQILTDEYFEDAEGQFKVDILKAMTNICQKLPTDDEKREWLVACGVHKSLVMLLHVSDILVLHCSLYALIGLSQCERSKIAIGELNCIEILLRIIENYDVASRKLAANLLRILCSDSNTREQVKVYEGIRICLSLLGSENVKLLWYLVWIIVQLSEDADSSDEIRLLGGIPLLLSLIHKDRVYHSDQNILMMSNDGAAKVSTDIESDNIEEVLSLKSAACTALTELVLNDTNAQEIVQANGIYLLSLLILPKTTSAGQPVASDETNSVEKLQKNALRALRFLFSMERNRQLFKILFTPDIFEMFIDVGHYVRDPNAYKSLVDKINSLSGEEISIIQSNIEATNKRRAPNRTVGSYAVLELLGSGAFGSVYKVCKKNGDGTCCAMKEISLTNPNLGKTMKERHKSIGNIIQETKIMKQQLSHPNVVKYLKAFQQKDKLFVIMEYIEGAALAEHFNSLKEKKDKFSEERIWNIFVQMVLGLRYLHKEKHIVHRDLTPNNVMLGSNDKVTITDFGLAKQKLPDASEFTSVVGTILYSCPEILQHLPYDEKADVWAAGCLLYQMATLQPPFYSSNMLQLATKIVEADYEPIPNELYSQKLIETVRRCITSDPKQRPDIVAVGSTISEIMMKYTDRLRVNEISLQRKLERERKRTQKHFHEANRNMQNYHRLFWANQERSDRMSHLSNSTSDYSVSRAGVGSDGSDGVLEVADAYKEGLPKGCNQNGDASQVDHLSSGTRQNHDSNSSSNEDILFGSADSRESPTRNNEQNVSPKSDSFFSVPHPPDRGRTPRRQLVLDISSVSKAKSAALPAGVLLSPGVSSPTETVAPHSFDHLKRRTQSSSSVELLRRGQSAGQTKARPPSATATLSISPRKVRQINDPILQLLNQLHKILFIEQLPPPLTSNPNRRIVEKFKRALFCQQTSSFNLKSEIKKVLEGSKDIIDLSFGFDHPSYLSFPSVNSSQAVPMQGARVEGDIDGVGITYEQMQAIIENVLMESGYYDMTPSIKQRPTPLGPIGGPSGR